MFDYLSSYLRACFSPFFFVLAYAASLAAKAAAHFFCLLLFLCYRILFLFASAFAYN